MIESLTLIIQIISFTVLPLQRTLVRCISVDGHSHIEFFGQGDCCSCKTDESQTQIQNFDIAKCRCNNCVDLPLELPNINGNQREHTQEQNFRETFTVLADYRDKVFFGKLFCDFGTTFSNKQTLLKNIRKIRFLI